VLALAGADVTLTDLAHITPLTQENADINASRCAVKPTVTPYMWGTPVSDIQAATQQQQQQMQQAQQEERPSAGGLEQQQQRPWDVIVAADVLYEPQYYDKLLSSLLQLCPSSTAAADSAEQQSSNGSSSSGESPPIYMCYRFRKYDERGFEARAEAAGFAVSAVPTEELHADYQCGGYRIIRLVRKQQQQQQQQLYLENGAS
jgi:hypothetical protein